MYNGKTEGEVLIKCLGKFKYLTNLGAEKQNLNICLLKLLKKDDNILVKIGRKVEWQQTN